MSSVAAVTAKTGLKPSYLLSGLEEKVVDWDQGLLTLDLDKMNSGY